MFVGLEVINATLSANYFGGDGETTFSVPDLRGEFLRGSYNIVRMCL